ncbi:co-regulatory protein PtrA N-terminal domain-containing protein [Pseudomonas sp. NPDC089741]|uniref:co-regulatory protein PtrA N-terminal domain-containing protein n=1 Tax=Pseudomonas sp. NPDC089741 TaxID=3364470 RepID=UPI003810951B
MKLAQISAFAAALAISSLALAEGGGDRTFERMMTSNDRSMELFVAKEKAAANPVVINEKKGDKTQDL